MSLVEIQLHIICMNALHVLWCVGPRDALCDHWRLFRQVPPRRTLILMTEDTRIAQDTSADATNARHLEKYVGPRRTRRVQPIAGRV